MIDRYTRPAMGRIWTEENKYRCWLQVESAASTVLAEDGVIPAAAADAIATKRSFSVARIHEIEAEVRHDVIAFTTAVAENLKQQGLDAESRWLHYGLTSNDVVDTAQALQVKEARASSATGSSRWPKCSSAAPSSSSTRPSSAAPTASTPSPPPSASSCSTGTPRCSATSPASMPPPKTCASASSPARSAPSAISSPEHEEAICARLGLKPAPVATQVIQRDRHAAYISTLAIIGSTLDKIAVEVRHLQRTEVREAEEYFSEKQKGSSAMPHKQNPITSEQISGLARVLRGNAQAAFENVALWHERDISHSSVERVIFPDSTILVDYLLAKTTDLIDRLLVYPERMKKNLEVYRRPDLQRPIAARSRRSRHAARRRLPAGAVPRHALMEGRPEFPRRSGAGSEDHGFAELGKAGTDIRLHAATWQRGRDFQASAGRSASSL